VPQTGEQKVRAEKAIDFAQKTLVADIRDWVFRVLADQAGSVAFRDLPEASQRTLKNDLTWVIAGGVAKATKIIASAGFETAPLQVAGFTVKEGIKVACTAERTDAILKTLSKAYGSQVILVLADPAVFNIAQADLFDGSTEVEATEVDADQGDDTADNSGEPAGEFPGERDLTDSLVEAVEADGGGKYAVERADGFAYDVDLPEAAAAPTDAVERVVGRARGRRRRASYDPASVSDAAVN
jgi:hypothetical protein